MKRIPCSPGTVISVVALFVALGGTTYAATGGNFVLGHANSADAPTSLTSTSTAGPALSLTSTGARPAASFVANSGVAPFKVSNATKIGNLDADLLDGFDSAGFLRSKVPVTVSGSRSAGGIIEASNTGSGGFGNGLQGKTDASLASGVYGENSGGGYGIAGRANGSHGAVFGENTGTGPALELHTTAGAAPMWVNSSAKVQNLNVDYLDGQDASDFLPADGTAHDSLELGGVPAASYARGQSATFAASPGFGEFVTAPIGPGFVHITFECSSYGGQIKVWSDDNQPVNSFRKTSSVRADDDFAYTSASTPTELDHAYPDTAAITQLTVQGTPGGVQTVATATIATAARSSDCHVHVQSLVTQQ
jgi:hypothetical protein